MGKFDGILIVTDIDGTFLGNKSRKVPENFEAIEYFKANGGVFTFASGRLHYSIDRVIPNPEKVANAPFILANGSCLYDFSLRKSVLTDCLNGHEAIPIFKYVREKYKTVGIRISSEIGFVVDELNDIIKRDNDGELDKQRQTSSRYAEFFFLVHSLQFCSHLHSCLDVGAACVTLFDSHFLRLDPSLSYRAFSLMYGQRKKYQLYR